MRQLGSAAVEKAVMVVVPASAAVRAWTVLKSAGSVALVGVMAREFEAVAVVVVVAGIVAAAVVVVASAPPAPPS